jgi:hypothetical protein
MPIIGLAMYRKALLCQSFAFVQFTSIRRNSGQKGERICCHPSVAQLSEQVQALLEKSLCLSQVIQGPEKHIPKGIQHVGRLPAIAQRAAQHQAFFQQPQRFLQVGALALVLGRDKS